MRDGRAPTELFLSHASRDHAFATKIAEIMRAHGVPVCYSPTSLVGGQQWHDEIGVYFFSEIANSLVRVMI